MKKFLKYELPVIIFYLLIIGALFWIGKELFEVIYYSDMPDWLKYMLLK